MKRRLLLIDLGAHFGGVENYLVNLADLLKGKIEVFALCVLPELEERLTERGVKVARIPIFPGILKPFRFMLAFLLLPVLLIRFRIQVVQLNGLLESLLILPARLTGRMAIYTRHGPFEVDLYHWLKNPLKFLPRKAAQLNVRLATHVVCVSEAVAESVRPVLPPGRYSVISNWVSGQKPFNVPHLNLSPVTRVLCASRLERYKGIHLLIEATRQLPNIQLTIAGDGGYRAALEELSHDMNNVQFMGFQRNLQVLYEGADVFVMPSLGPEGLPMTSLEAMACGIPCIFSDLPVHKEITDGGKGAYLFRSGDGDSLLEGLRTLCASSEIRLGYAAEAHRIVASRYTDECVRAAYLQVFSGGEIYE